MITVIGGGGGFKGLGAYLLHDQNTDTAERVEWTASRNLDGATGARAVNLMTATAMSQERLKEEAGLKKSGRKCKEPLAHITLAWHEDDASSREEMEAAADEALKALGATDYQALYVAHNDTPHRHMHIVLNRISPEDGRALSMSYSQKKLSAWALDYQKRHGQEHCPERKKKAEARERGETVEGEKRVPRQLYELRKSFRFEAASNDNLPAFERFLREQKTLDRRLKADTRQMHQTHRERSQKLWTAFKQQKRELWQERQRDYWQYEQKIRARRDKELADQRETARDEWRQFFAQERSVAGVVRNIRDAAKRAAETGERGRLSALWRVTMDSHERRGTLQQVHERERAAIWADYSKAKRGKVEQIKADHKAKLDAAREAFGNGRELVSRKAELERQANREQWQQRNRDRAAAYEAFRDQQRGIQRERTVQAAEARQQRAARRAERQANTWGYESVAPMTAPEAARKVNMAYETGPDGRKSFVDPTMPEPPKKAHTIDGRSPYEATKAAAQRSAHEHAPKPVEGTGGRSVPGPYNVMKPEERGAWTAAALRSDRARDGAQRTPSREQRQQQAAPPPEKGRQAWPQATVEESAAPGKDRKAWVPQVKPPKPAPERPPASQIARPAEERWTAPDKGPTPAQRDAAVKSAASGWPEPKVDAPKSKWMQQAEERIAKRAAEKAQSKDKGPAMAK